ncbi:MAG TPA: hypothetical protein VFG54_13320 [Prolixibacteraceae bacterium]|nr:hypothetical protein [Prolixibacteraceae bacterium]
MAESNKAVKGEQPKDNQKDAQKETTDPYMNKNPVVAKARPRKPAASGTKTVSKASSSTASKSRGNGSASSAQKGNRTGARPSGNQNTSASDNKNEDTTKKIMVSKVSDDVVPIEGALNQTAGPTEQDVPAIVQRDEYVQSVAEQLTNGEERAQQLVGDKRDKKKGKKEDKREKKVRKLEKKSQKAEKKVDKLMDKYKTAQKEEVKRSKLQNIKDMLLKAYAKLRKRHRKLRAVSK